LVRIKHELQVSILNAETSSRVTKGRI